MNEQLKQRIVRRLETLADDRGYQILDFVEFLESKYAVLMHPLPSDLQTMPHPCAGVPRNPWCPGKR